jgi:hypothetical protein
LSETYSAFSQISATASSLSCLYLKDQPQPQASTLSKTTGYTLIQPQASPALCRKVESQPQVCTAKPKKDQYQVNLFRSNKTCHDRPLPSFFKNIIKLKKYFAELVWTCNVICACAFFVHPPLPPTTSNIGSRQGDLADLELIHYSEVGLLPSLAETGGGGGGGG